MEASTLATCGLTKDGAIMIRLRRQRTGASWRDLEQAKVAAQRHELLEVEFITEDTSSVNLDPTSWNNKYACPTTTRRKRKASCVTTMRIGCPSWRLTSQNTKRMKMEQAEQNAPEPTFDLAATLDTEGMVVSHGGFTKTYRTGLMP